MVFLMEKQLKKKRIAQANEKETVKYFFKIDSITHHELPCSHTKEG